MSASKPGEPSFNARFRVKTLSSSQPKMAGTSLASSSTVFNRNDGVDVIPTRSETSIVRTRRQATRARTGCMTCRYVLLTLSFGASAMTRHVKCDEGRPACRRCLVGGFRCRGYTLPPPAEGTFAPVITDSTILSARSQQEPRDKNASVPPGRRYEQVVKETEPPRWDFMQAIRYYFEIIKPTCSKENGEVLDPPFDCPIAVVPVFFTSNIIGTRMALECKRQGALFLSTSPPGSAELRATYARYALELINITNHCIRGGSYWGAKRVFGCFCTLLYLDLSACDSLWQAHIKGCLAYVRDVFGGVAVVVNWSFPIVTFTRLLFKAIVFDTTTPVGKQVLQYTTYTDEQLQTLFSYRLDENMPCSVELRILMIHVTSLRDQARTVKAPARRAKLTSTILELFVKIDEFDTDSWARDNSAFELSQDVGHIFQLAIRLYGILSLPRSAVVAWARSVAYPRLPGSGTYDSVRISEGSKLVGLLRRVYPRVDYRPGIRWPVVVAGVAVADGAAEDREFVDQSLFEIWQHPLAEHGPLLCLQKLRILWRSSRTGWEDCFDEPVPC